MVERHPTASEPPQYPPGKGGEAVAGVKEATAGAFRLRDEIGPAVAVETGNDPKVGGDQERRG